MRLQNAVAAEFRKAATLPGVRAGLAVALFGSAALTLLNSFTVRQELGAGRQDLLADSSPFETAFGALPLGTVGAVIIGIVIISSEYAANSSDAGGGRQITSTITATAHRATVLAAKAIVLAVMILMVAAVTLPVTVLIARGVIGDAGTEPVSVGEGIARSVGGALYWTLSGLIAFAVTTVIRSGVLPLVFFIMNSSLVSFSLLLSNVTPLAYWLPDAAGVGLFAGPYAIEGGLDAVPGALVMGGWTGLLLVVAAVVFSRRDA